MDLNKIGVIEVFYVNITVLKGRLGSCFKWAGIWKMCFIFLLRRRSCGCVFICVCVCA